MVNIEADEGIESEGKYFKKPCTYIREPSLKAIAQNF